MGKKPYIRKLRNIKRILNARILYVCDEYIDYIEPDKWGERHGFAHINKKDFEPSEFDQTGGLLEEAVRWGNPVNLVVETREVPPFEGKGKLQKCDYLLSIESPA